MKYLSKIILFLFFFISVFSCRKDDIITNSTAKLAFSQESVLFDTVFTTVGSTTRQFKIYNNNSKTINISTIKLAGGKNSNFRINIDGTPIISANNVTIPPKDSLYVFVEVTVDPNNLGSPLIIRDSLVFETNGNIQDVDLEAWGQDAYYHKPTVFPLNGFPPYSIIDCNSNWTNDKPHVIYSYAVVDSGCTLSIEAGTRVHLHNKAVLWIYKDATLKINGMKSNEVIFQGDRMELEYKDVPGQWGKIWLSPGSRNNSINWAIIKNGNIGIQADTLGKSMNPTLRISNTIVKNMSAAAIYGQGSFIRGYNCVFANCGQYVAALNIGGKYSFTHCTFANYWNSTRNTPLLVLNNYYQDNNQNIQIRNLDSAYFGNCILYGSIANEIGLDSSSYGGAFNFYFDNCLLKIDPTLNTSNSIHYNNIIKNKDPEFVSYYENVFKIGSHSVAINNGDINIGKMYPIDLDMNSRINDSAPDLGAFEFKP